MKRCILMAGFVLAFVVPTATAHVSQTNKSKYSKLYIQVANKLGKRAPGRNIINDGLSTGATVTDAIVLKSIGVLQGMLAPAPTPTSSSPASTATSSYASSGSYADVPGVPASFAACVALRESTDGAGSSNIYGILGPGGQGSVAEQKQAFSQMYAARGAEPWSPYDGC